MKLFLKILFFVLAIFQTNISEGKVIVFGNVISEIKFTIDNVESKNKSNVILENDFGITCKSESDLVDYRNLVSSCNANAAKGAGLADDVANTFRFGRYTEVTLDKPMVLLRYYDNVNAFAKGRFMTNSTSGFTFLDRMGMAIRPSWNGMTKVAHREIPAGSTIYQGRAAMQFPWFGGKTQYFVPELGNIKRVIK